MKACGFEAKSSKQKGGQKLALAKLRQKRSMLSGKDGNPEVDEGLKAALARDSPGAV
jgi:hypothetical protein